MRAAGSRIASTSLRAAAHCKRASRGAAAREGSAAVESFLVYSTKRRGRYQPRWRDCSKVVWRRIAEHEVVLRKARGRREPYGCSSYHQASGWHVVQERGDGGGAFGLPLCLEGFAAVKREELSAARYTSEAHALRRSREDE